MVDTAGLLREISLKMHQTLDGSLSGQSGRQTGNSGMSGGRVLMGGSQ